MMCILKAIAKPFKRNLSTRIFVLVKYEGSNKLYFCYRKHGVDKFSPFRAAAWFFERPSLAREARDYIGLKNELNIESFERI